MWISADVLFLVRARALQHSCEIWMIFYKEDIEWVKKKRYMKRYTCTHMHLVCVHTKQKAIRDQAWQGAHLISISKSVMYRNRQPLLSMAAKCSDTVFEIGLTFGLLVHEIINISQYGKHVVGQLPTEMVASQKIGVTLYYFLSSNYWQCSSCTWHSPVHLPYFVPIHSRGDRCRVNNVSSSWFKSMRES